jgi:hypothetical protein
VTLHDVLRGVSLEEKTTFNHGGSRDEEASNHVRFSWFGMLRLFLFYILPKALKDFVRHLVFCR